MPKSKNPNPVAAGNTPQAKDDSYGAAQGEVRRFAVMDNDLGGNAKWLYSLQQDNLLSQSPTGTTQAGATITIDGDEIVYDPGSLFDHLPDGETATDTFEYAIRMANGTVSIGEVTVQVTGTNDAATISGVATGEVVEDGVQVASGTITVGDVDDGENRLQDPASLDGSYGQFTLAADTGQWTYTLDNDSDVVQALAEGETVTDTLTVTSLDGTASTDIVVTITGTNDVAEISGATTGVVSEDGILETGGTLAVSDRDNGESAFGPASSLAGDHGTFTFDGDTGEWTYALHNGSPAVQSLALGETLTDSLTVTSLDGTASQDVIVTIDGANDDPVIDTGASDLDGLVVDVASETFVFTVGQWYGYQNVGSFNELEDMRTHMMFRPVSITQQYTVIDFTDDVANAAGAYAINNPWPYGEAQGATGRDGYNDAFIARVTATFTVTTPDTYTFQTLSDDNAFVLVDGVLVIDDPLIHSQALRSGSIALDAGAHEVEVVYYEQGQIGLLELTAAGSNGEFHLLDGTKGLIPDPVLSDTGTIVFTDIDTSDRPTASFEFVAGDSNIAVTEAQYEALAAGFSITEPATNTNVGTVDWRFAIASSKAEFLGASDAVTLQFAVTVDDGNGGTDREIVEIWIEGANDVATISGDLAGAVVEDGTLEASGMLVASDPDSGEARFAAPASLSGTYGIFGFDPETGAWTYVLDNGADAVQALAGGETVTDTLAVTSLDGTATQDITVTITGTNDAPVAASLVVGVREDDPATGPSSDILAEDIDTGEDELLTFAYDLPTITRGHFEIDGDGDLFLSPDGEYESLAKDQIVTIEVPFTATDPAGESDSGLITFKVIGANDAPVAVNDPGVTITENGLVPVTFSPVGDAYAAGPGEYVITPDVEWMGGALWSDSKIELDASSTIKAQLYFGTKDLNGADGFAFVIQNQGNAIIGGLGSGLGYQGIGNSVAIEFDTFSNYGELALDHTALGLAGNLYGTPTALGGGNVEDGAWHDVAIRFDAAASTLSLDFDGVEVSSYNVALSSQVRSLEAYIGFTGSTGMYFNDQRIRELTYESEAKAIVLDVLANDSDIDTGDTIRVVSATSSLGAEVVVTAQGSSVSYSVGDTFAYLKDGESVVDTVTYTIEDQHGEQSTATIEVTVLGETEGPQITSADTEASIASRFVYPRAAWHLNETEANDTNAIANRIEDADFRIVSYPNLYPQTLPSVNIDGRISGNGDVDVYAFELQAGDRVWFDIDDAWKAGDGIFANGDLDSRLVLRSTSGQVASNIDYGGEDGGGSDNSRDPFITYQVPTSGTYFLEVRPDNSYNHASGTYELNVVIRPQPTVLSDQGSILLAATDGDGTYTVTATPLGYNLVGTLSLTPVDNGSDPDRIDWTFEIDADVAAPYDNKTQEYLVEITDGDGLSVTQMISVHINDSSVI